MKVVVKVGTQSILSEEGTPFESVIRDLVLQIAAIRKEGHHIVLVSSGAVSSGRCIANKMFNRRYGRSIGEKQLLASLGQYELMHLYSELFKTHQMLASQLLLTKQDFHTRKHYLNIARLIREIFEHKNIVPIINENDSVAIEELMFTDNDELAGLISAQMNADKLIILSNVEGVYSENPSLSSAQLITQIDPKKAWPAVSDAKSAAGRGGMVSKLQTARHMSTLGITTHIASLNQDAVILRLMNDEAVGTTILPNKKKSNIKKWMTYNTDKKTGTILINECLCRILKEQDRAVSILPVGIQQSKGQFKKGDLVELVTEEGLHIGIGVAKYDAVKLHEYLGQKDKPEFIHYDYLHIF